jgi:glutamine synthetase adenylyltransferase
MTNWLILSIESDLTPYHRSQTLDSLYTFGQSENNELKKLKKVYHFLKPVIYILQKQNIDQSQTLLAELYLKALQRIDHLSSLYGHLTNPIKNPKKYFSVSLRDNKNLKSNLENLFEQNLEERSKQANETIQNVNKAPLERSKLVDKILQQKDGQKKIQNQWVPEGN